MIDGHPTLFPRGDLSVGSRSSIKERPHKVHVADLAKPIPLPTSVLDGLPSLLAARELRTLLEAIRQSWRDGTPVVIGIGGHVVKCGLAPLVVELLRRGKITAVAMNGGAAVHDAELACWGATSEVVEDSLPQGSFGMVDETGALFAKAIGTYPDASLAEALGAEILTLPGPWRSVSILAAGQEHGVPVTVHTAVGADTVHFHPCLELPTLAKTLIVDLQVLSAIVEDLLNGGVYLNCGSAVLLPEIFLKLLNRARAATGDVGRLTTANFDMATPYRPLVNVVRRPPHPNGAGFNFIGQHETLLTLFLQVLLGA